MIVLAAGLLLESLHAAMPFGRLMPLHYGPDDIRTLVILRPKSAPLLSSLPSIGLPTAGPSAASPKLGIEMLKAASAIRPFSK